jgi:hypothetical protein
MRTHISFQTNLKKTQITETPEAFLISGVPVVVDGAVMNGITYPADENEKGLDSLVNRVVTLRHPFDSKGHPIDAYDPQALQNQFSGGVVTKRYKVGKVNLVDINIKKSLLQAQDNGQSFYDRLTNKEEIGVSTGLYTNVVNNTATEQTYNHLAMLESDEEPAGGDATKMKFNGAETMVVNIDQVINGMDGSMNDKRDMLNTAIKQRFGGIPQTYVYLLDWSEDAAIFEIESQSKYNTYQIGWTEKDGKIELVGDPVEVKRKTVWQTVTNAAKKLTELFANRQKVDDNTTGRGQRDNLNNEVKTMLTREQVINMLKGKGVTVDESHTDAQLTEQLTNSLAAKPEPKGEPVVNADLTNAITAAVNAAVKPLNDQLTKLQANAEADAQAKKAAAVSAILAANSVYTKDELEAMPETVLNKMAAQFVPAYSVNSGNGQFNPQAEDEFKDYSMNAAIDAAQGGK